MSDAAFRSRSGSPAPADGLDLGEHFVPKASSLFGGDRMAGVNSEREAASAQMQRSLKAWRKAKDDDAPQSYVPQASGGKPLPTDVRKKMEPRLGTDLSGVRMHDGGEAAQASNKLGARAFTVGSDVHFNSGEFNPGTREGDKLIAHELTHVVQGQNGAIQRKEKEDDNKAAGPEVSEEGEPAEVEADAKSEEVAGDIHDEKKDKDDKKKDDKKGKEEGSGLDAANEEDEKKKKGGEEGGAEAEGEEKKDDVKQAAPATAAKLFRKIYLKKPAKASPEQEKKAAELEATLKADTSAAKAAADNVKGAVKGGAVIAGAIVGFFVGGPPGAMAGASAAGIGVTLFNAAKKFLGFHDEREAVFEERQKALDNIELLKSQPGVLDKLLDDITTGKTATKEFFEELEKLVEAMPRVEKRAAERRLKKDKEKAAKDKKAAGLPAKGGNAAENMEKGAIGAEGGEASLEVLEKLAELGHGAAGAAHVLQGVALGLDIAAVAASNMRAKREAEQLKQLKDGN